ncbi:WD repeat protein [Tritrichomonas foetus]|uniref:WD repeat protein n=1 Tax=Tritrichomonas foetus TaxID=1144522 RepID=A0A1J4K9A7_9EUKA|nr:WD repeat protein [Tritrichomonas foetus]|eukprot:OHT07480.1 WD repeat protein [Tritrichomonas foetus]
MAITSYDVNNLVWRYLSESGFQHSAFLFRSESLIDEPDSANPIVPDSLITILQKAILYMKLEKIVKVAKRDENNELHSQINELEKHFPTLAEPPPRIPTPRQPISLAVTPEVAQILHGHQLCVFGCSWSPDGTLLATASADGTSIIWTMNNDKPVSRKILGAIPAVLNTDHGITTIDWNSSGTLFATGSFDTFVKIYHSDGNLYASLNGHTHSVFVVRFNPSGKYIVTCSADHTAILWSVHPPQILHVFNHHTDTILDVSWKDNSIFATASADTTIGICNVSGADHFLRGHTGHVTAVAWSNDGEMLASASEDQTVRIWQDNRETLVLSAHKTGVSCIKWLPKSDHFLVSASQDGTVCVWDANQGTLIHLIEGFSKDVISLAVSPCGQYIAFSGVGVTIQVAKALTGEKIAVITGTTPIYEIQWDPSGRYLAICFDDSTVAVLQSAIYLNP